MVPACSPTHGGKTMEDARTGRLYRQPPAANSLAISQKNMKRIFTLCALSISAFVAFAPALRADETCDPTSPGCTASTEEPPADVVHGSRMVGENDPDGWNGPFMIGADLASDLQRDNPGSAVIVTIVNDGAWPGAQSVYTYERTTTGTFKQCGDSANPCDGN